MNVKPDTWINLGGAVVLHLILLGLLLIRLPESKPQPALSAPAEPVIQARAISEEEVMAPVRQRQAEEADRQRRIEAEKRAAEERRRAEVKRQAEAKRQAEEQRKAAAEAKRKADAEAKQKAEAEAKRKAEAEAKQQAEAQRKAEQEARQKAELEARKKAEEAARQQQEQARRQAQEQALREQMAAEQRRLDEEAARFRQTQLERLQNEYVSQISDKVRRNWLRPDGSRGTLCAVVINQLPNGEVVGVRVMNCDGDASFQRSVENAVYRASPLPLPADRALFSREIQFNFRPQ